MQFATITFFFNSLGEFLYRNLERRLAQHVRDFISRTYSLDLPKIVIEQPPKVEFGEYALPLAFELAKKLRKAPRKIAEEIVNGIGPIPGFEKLELAGAGYINARLKRDELAAALVADEKPRSDVPAGKILVEHSSINPNKAAHVGHLRNAILGDTFVRLLKFAGREVDIQNYIDNTGAQVADVVVGFLNIEKKSRDRDRAVGPPAALRLLLLGSLRPGLAVVRAGQAESAGPPASAARNRGRRQRNCRHRRSDFCRCPAPSSGDHGSSRHRIRFSAARKRNSPPSFLGRGLYQAQRRRSDFL